ncbi:hypothetical protein RHMOL_Rhmol05G0164800 [Rhododendron molle]|uniref:Uncharacterized protein n=1 Tax=Rhododendron molle TaxID=49168 RepID=A0ACC0NR73_RHOML|nr:hypothetical protein RHMOL_Rhmol05G0164800 [Rhododendron molle]
MAEHGDSGDRGEVVNHPRDEGASMEPKIGDQTVAMEVTGTDAETTSGGDGVQDCEQEAVGGEEHRTVEPEPRAMDEAGAVGPRVDPGGPSSTVEGSYVIGGSDVVTGNRDASGGETGLNGSPPRDSDKRKGAAVEEEQTIETLAAYREEDVAFSPAASTATSSSHVPVTKYDIAEHLPDQMLAKVLEGNPTIGEYVVKAKEDRARAIEASEVAERAERERAGPEGLVDDIEAEEGQGPRVRAVDEAGAMIRPEFSEETYVPPRPHLFVPSGFPGFKPQQTDYDVELVLRDP